MIVAHQRKGKYMIQAANLRRGDVVELIDGITNEVEWVSQQGSDPLYRIRWTDGSESNVPGDLLYEVVQKTPSGDSFALNLIADLVGLDEDGCWTDESGLLESIAYIIMETGRQVEGF